jgi:hypothetical protein
MPGRSRNLHKTELPDCVGSNYCSESGLFLSHNDFDDAGIYTELRNPEVTVRTMSENEDFDDNDRDNRYELHCFLSILETNNTYLLTYSMEQSPS